MLLECGTNGVLELKAPVSDWEVTTEKEHGFFSHAHVTGIIIEVNSNLFLQVDWKINDWVKVVAVNPKTDKSKVIKNMPHLENINMSGNDKMIFLGVRDKFIAYVKEMNELLG